MVDDKNSRKIIKIYFVTQKLKKSVLLYRVYDSVVNRNEYSLDNLLFTSKNKRNEYRWIKVDYSDF